MFTDIRHSFRLLWKAKRCVLARAALVKWAEQTAVGLLPLWTSVYREA